MSAPAIEDSSLERLRALLLEEGGLMASLLDTARQPGADAAYASAEVAADDRMRTVDGMAPRNDGVQAPGALPPDGPAQLAASGPRVGARAADYELLLDTIYEGYLLHYRAPRVVCPPEADLGLLAGDRLYALGLARLVKLGDVEAVAELADVITLSALAHAAGEPELAEAVWAAGARAVGWGASPQHDHAKALARGGSPDALEAMRRLAAG